MAGLVLLGFPARATLGRKFISHSFLRSAKGSSRSMSLDRYVVTPEEVLQALAKKPPTTFTSSPRTIPLCASWFMPNDPEGRTGLSVFKQKHMPSARFFDLDAVKDNGSPYPHMLPSPEDFAKAMSDLGIRQDDEVVVYDTAELGIFSAPRVGWMLKAFSHQKVHLLNNFKLWVEEGYPTESGDQEQFDPVDYPVPQVEKSMVADFDEVKQKVLDLKQGRKDIQILDARSAGRWSGADPEPRPGLSSGHMPGSISVPFNELLDPVSKTLLPGNKLRELFQSKGVQPDRPIISSCGTGVTAVVIDAALSEADYVQPNDKKIYDGSWTEWAQRTSVEDGLIVKADR